MTRRPAWKDWTALVAAYVLVLQVVVAGLAAGLATGAMAAPAPKGPGAVLCHGAADAGTLPTTGDGPAAHGAPCCIMGCATLGPLAAPPPADAALPARPFASAARMPRGQDVPARAGAAGTSNLARAPPAA